MYQIVVDFIYQTAITGIVFYSFSFTKEMKKIYLVCCLLMVFVIAGCSFTQKTFESLTGDNIKEVQMEKKKISEVSTSEMEEFTGVVDSGAFDSGNVHPVEGSSALHTGDAIFDEVAKLIQERNNKAKDDAKLTEEDIDLLEKIIEKIKEEVKK